MSNKLLKDDTGKSMDTTLKSILAALTTRNSKLDTQNAYINAWGGALSSLTTGDKSSLVAAINWVYAKEQAHEQTAAMHDVFAFLDSVSNAETGAFIHNSLARGKSLGSSPTADQYARIVDRTYKDLWLGDYWSKSVTFSYLVPPKDASGYAIQGDDTSTSATIAPVMRIGDHDYYRYAGDNINLQTGHLNIIPDANLYTAPMNKKDANGANFTTGAYAGSEMRTKYLDAAVSIFESFFGANHVLKYRDFLQNAVASGRPSGGSWYDCKVELMDERQVYGGLVFDSESLGGSTVPYRYTVATKQFALFKFAPWLISNRQWFWLRNVVSAAWFAFVSSLGSCNHSHASAIDGVRPAALIG